MIFLRLFHSICFVAAPLLAHSPYKVIKWVIIMKRTKYSRPNAHWLNILRSFRHVVRVSVYVDKRLFADDSYVAITWLRNKKKYKSPIHLIQHMWSESEYVNECKMWMSIICGPCNRIGPHLTKTSKTPNRKTIHEFNNLQCQANMRVSEAKTVCLLPCKPSQQNKHKKTPYIVTWKISWTCYVLPMPPMDIFDMRCDADSPEIIDFTQTAWMYFA